jgi:hypothetical protein
MQHFEYVHLFLVFTQNHEFITIQVRFCADHRIKPHVPPLSQIPASSVKFRHCRRTPQAEYFRVSLVF